jgi:hypothetical protein
MSNELSVRNVGLANMDEIERAASAMSKSGYFTDAKDLAQAVTKILAGREMGFGPFASMTGIYIIQGRPSIGANLMASAVKASGRYNYKVAEMTDDACEIIFFEQGKECGRSRFTSADAKKAGTKNMSAFPRNMLFARAMSNGCRWYCPDVFLGAPTYTPEELGANVNEAGEVIDVIPTITTPEPAAPVTPEAPAYVLPVIDLAAAKLTQTSDGKAYGDMPDAALVKMRSAIWAKVKANNLTDDSRADYLRKIASINIILGE